jgi:gliding motility associated protien GldN
MISVVTTTWLTSDQVTRFRLKEDWHFDKQRGKVDIRIIGLAPMREVRSESGEVLGHAPLFWLYYPELRYYLANQEVFTSGNEAQRITFEQLFAKRRFASTIDKVSNVHDRGSSAYLAGVDALLVGERIKHDLFAYEHDLWNW